MNFNLLIIDYNEYGLTSFFQLSQVMSLRTMEMEDGEQQVVAVRLANLQMACQLKGVSTMPETA